MVGHDDLENGSVQDRPYPVFCIPMPYVSLDDLIAGARDGHLISFPTDTVPALASLPTVAERLFDAKQRSTTKPLILMGARSLDLWPYVSGSEPDWLYWQEVAEQHWPGAITLVLPASDRLPPAMNPTDPTTIGLRVPNHGVARHILAQTGPLATTSANRSGQPALQTLAEIAATFPEVLVPTAEALATLDIGQTTAAGLPSTVAQWTGGGWKILRQGGVRL
jgi:L-threonylcarbamoyladenylate synthase